MTENATVRIRPLRLGFLIDPADPKALRHVLQINSCLWGGTYNYIVPVFKKTPNRYREKHFKAPSASTIIHGMLEAFQPDFLVETRNGISAGLPFAPDRILPVQDILAADETGRRRYGVDLTSVCDALYQESFQFVHRHPLKVLIPKAPSKRFESLFAAIFGELPKSEGFAKYREVFTKALGATEKEVVAAQFYQTFERDVFYPMRVGRYELDAKRKSWSRGPILFYMDERSSYDIIEYWNLRAIGWRIRPLPSSWAETLRPDCEQYIRDVHRPYPPPSNVIEDATFMCSRSCSFEEMQKFVSTLNRPSDWHLVVDPHFPRIWEEWGRSADHVEPQLVTYKTETTTAHVIGDSMHLRTVMPTAFENLGNLSSEAACANIIETIPGGSEVIPWRTANLKQLTGSFRTDRVWVGREGMVAIAGLFNSFNFVRIPNPVNVFSAWAENHGLTFSLSPPGRSAEQVVSALGGLSGVSLIGDSEIIKLLDRLAHGDLELETGDSEQSRKNKKRRKRKEAAPLGHIKQILNRANGGHEIASGNHLKALLDHNVLKIGISLECPNCTQTSWYSLANLQEELTCNRCLQKYRFPANDPPTSAWTYRTNGPFAVENYAQGAYSVSFAANFIAENIAVASTWIPSFVLEDDAGQAAEADFGMFIKLGHLARWQDPIVVFGECKTFDYFEARDFQRMRRIAKLFPGAVLCFCTLRNELTAYEKKRMAKLARAGRKSLKSGFQKNPVLILTGIELLGQFGKSRNFIERYPEQFRKRADRWVFRGDIKDSCSFTQQVHLGIESHYDWLKATWDKKTAALAKRAKPEASPATGQDRI
jgi:hypothetical protein